MADEKPVIVIKKKGGHGGHHGGAWKIAYADFVTAMMAFFMVMWLVNSAADPVKQSIASYFRKPGIFNEGSGTPLLLGGAGILEDAFAPPRPEDKTRAKTNSVSTEKRRAGESDQDLDKKYMQEGSKEPQKGKGPDQVQGLNSDQKQLEEVKKTIEIKQKAEELKSLIAKKLASSPMKEALGKVEFKVEPDGLTIEIMDTNKSSMFQSGSAVIRPEARQAFAQVTESLRSLPNMLEISGHTDAKPFPSRAGTYTNWELSADRANAARRLMEGFGFPAPQVRSVVGKAAQELKYPEDPEAPANRRITLKMKLDMEQQVTVTRDGQGVDQLDQILNAPPIGAGSPAAQGTSGDVDAGPTPTPSPTPSPTPRPEITSAPRRASGPRDLIQLPEGAPPTANPDYIEDDKVFRDKPVVGRGELFSGM
jgi:chemotaxis protein MotB